MRSDIRAALGRRVVLLPLVVVVFAAMFGGWHLLRGDTATGQAFAIVTAPGAEDLTQQNAAIFTAKSSAKAYVLLGQDTELLQEVADDLGYAGGAAVLAEMVTVTQPVDTATLAIETEGTTPEAAQQLADAVVSAMSERVEELQPETPPEARLVLEPIYPPSAASAGPSLAVDLLTGAVVGLLVGLVALWFLADRRSGRGETRRRSASRRQS